MMGAPPPSEPRSCTMGSQGISPVMNNMVIFKFFKKNKYNNKKKRCINHTNSPD